MTVANSTTYAIPNTSPSLELQKFKILTVTLQHSMWSVYLKYENTLERLGLLSWQGTPAIRINN